MAYVTAILYLIFICMAFSVAAYSFASNDLNVAVVATALMAIFLFIGQARSWTQKREAGEVGGFWRKLTSLWVWHNPEIVVVGVATHYSALMIGVSSFGTVVLDVPIRNTTIIIVIIQQVFLNYAAAMLVDAFRRARIEKS